MWVGCISAYMLYKYTYYHTYTNASMMYEFTIPNYHPMMAQKRGDKGMAEGEWRKGGKISSNTINIMY
jgi:hypothetical protein